MTPAKLAVWPALVAAALGSLGCEAEVITGPLPVDPDEPPPEQLPPAGLVDKVDLLLVVDGSIAMAHKQAVLVPSVRRLIHSLVNPACVDGQGAPLDEAEQPADGLQDTRVITGDAVAASTPASATGASTRPPQPFAKLMLWPATSWPQAAPYSVTTPGAPTGSK